MPNTDIQLSEILKPFGIYKNVEEVIGEKFIFTTLDEKILCGTIASIGCCTDTELSLEVSSRKFDGQKVTEIVVIKQHGLGLVSLKTENKNIMFVGSLVFL